jgi:glutamine amidotransferase
MVALIDYGAVEIKSIEKILSDLGCNYVITNKEYDILKSSKVILPGDGEISSSVKQLHKNNLFTMLRVCKKPILGINTGMQIFADHISNGNVSGLGIFPGTVEKFDSEISEVPFVGMNSVELKIKSRLFNGIESGEKFYFEHSCFLPINIYTTSAADNKTAFSASVETGNYYGIQFNPEKSGEAGLKLLKNFIEI